MCLEETFGIQRLCQFMSKPNHPYFQVALHMLHHFCCHPPEPLIYYHNINHTPITKLLQGVPKFDGFDPIYVVFVDSAHGDSDERRSTACDMKFYQGGLINHISWVPTVVPVNGGIQKQLLLSCSHASSLHSKDPLQAVVWQGGYYVYCSHLC